MNINTSFPNKTLPSAQCIVALCPVTVIISDLFTTFQREGWSETETLPAVFLSRWETSPSWTRSSATSRAGSTMRWGEWRTRWTSSGVSWSADRRRHSGKPPQGDFKRGLRLIWVDYNDSALACSPPQSLKPLSMGLRWKDLNLLTLQGSIHILQSFWFCFSLFRVVVTLFWFVNTRVASRITRQ